MKRIIASRTLVLVCSLGFLCSSLAFAKDDKWKNRTARRNAAGNHQMHGFSGGAGLALSAGTYSGLSLLYPFQHNSFIQASIGIGILKGTLSVTGDYAMEFPDLFDTGGFVIPYAGAGFVAMNGEDYASLVSDTDGDSHFGLRVPVGAYVMMNNFPIQLYGEITPGFLIMPKINPILSLTVGFRWMF